MTDVNKVIRRVSEWSIWWVVVVVLTVSENNFQNRFLLSTLKLAVYILPVETISEANQTAGQ